MEIAEVKENKTKRERKDINLNTLAPRWPFRMVVCGASGCGKTNMVIDLIERFLPWTALGVYARHLDNKQYTQFRERIQKYEKKKKAEVSTWADTLDAVVPVDDLCPDNRTLILFDDFVMAKDQSIIEDYFTRARHKNCSVIYICQSWYNTPKVVRLNASHVAVFKGANGFDKTGIWKDVCSSMKREVFDEYYDTAIHTPYGFIFVDKNPLEPELEFHIKFDQLFLPPT